MACALLIIGALLNGNVRRRRPCRKLIAVGADAALCSLHRWKSAGWDCNPSNFSPGIYCSAPAACGLPSRNGLPEIVVLMRLHLDSRGSFVIHSASQMALTFGPTVKHHPIALIHHCINSSNHLVIHSSDIHQTFP